MESIKIEVIGNIAKIIERPTRITAGTVGLPVEFTFDSQWDGLTKMAIFRAGCTSIIVDKVTDSTTVPWEVLEKPNTRLRIGFFGVNEDGTVAIPTIWANVSVIQDGADPSGEPGGDPTLPIWNQLENDIEDLDNKIEERFQNIETDRLLFEQSGGEGISMECESQAVLKFAADDNNVILRGIAPAEDDNDAVNKKQLDDAIAGVSGGSGGGVSTFDIELGWDEDAEDYTGDGHLATDSYKDILSAYEDGNIVQLRYCTIGGEVVFYHFVEYVDDVLFRFARETWNGKELVSVETDGMCYISVYSDDSGGSVNVDETLTISGAAADAKVTGERITEVFSSVYRKTEGSEGSINLLPPITQTGIIDTASDNFGKIKEHSSYYTSDYFPVKPGTKIVYTRMKDSSTRMIDGAYRIGFYKEDKSTTSVLHKTGTALDKAAVDVPTDAAYARISIMALMISVSYKHMVEYTEDGTTISPVFVAYVAPIEPGIKRIIPIPYEGKNICVFGDSLAASGSGGTDTWIQRVGDALLCNKVYNRGVGGSRVTGTDASGNAVTQYAYVDAEGDAYNRMSYPSQKTVSGYTEINAIGSSTDRANTIPTDTDAVFILFGANDVGNTKADTFIADYKTMLDNIYARVPSADIYLCTMPFHQGFDLGEYASVYEAYRDRIRKIGAEYGFPVIELKNEMMVNKNNCANFMTDSVHYNNNAGRDRTARAVLTFGSGASGTGNSSSSGSSVGGGVSTFRGHLYWDIENAEYVGCELDCTYEDIYNAYQSDNIVQLKCEHDEVGEVRCFYLDTYLDGDHFAFTHACSAFTETIIIYFDNSCSIHFGGDSGGNSGGDITFSIVGGLDETHTCKAGTTWAEFVSNHEDEGWRLDENDMIEYVAVDEESGEEYIMMLYFTDEFDGEVFGADEIIDGHTYGIC